MRSLFYLPRLFAHSRQFYLFLLFPTIKYSSREALGCIKKVDPIGGNMLESENTGGDEINIERGKKAKENKLEYLLLVFTAYFLCADPLF